MPAPPGDSAVSPAEPAVPGAPTDAHGLRPGVAGLCDLMDRLLAPDGCPWDRAQTLDSLRPYLLEETHEVLAAMDEPAAHRGELGDLLFQIVFQSALRRRQGHFGWDDVVGDIRAKMVRRHPHVFGPGATEAGALSADDVAAQWEVIKGQERAAAEASGTAPGRQSPFGSLPTSLPALIRASRMQDKAAALGFDWPDLQGALDKFDEEWRELTEARAQGEPAAIAEELGDLLFVLCRIASKLGVHPEQALRQANAKFARRFGAVLDRCAQGGIDPTEAGLSRLDALWNEVKDAEG